MLQSVPQKSLSIYHSLYRWYHQYGRRDLPWRNTDDAYHIYVSEVMLQQTQVKTVLERFYFPFLQQFPTLDILAKANIQNVLKAWEGLGYYTRARNLHRTAQMTVPELPENIKELQKLPGIGKNTAHAIAVFAYRQPVPVMEANVKRVLRRFFALQSASEKELWTYADLLLDTKHPFDYNQAMMDIGALLCTTKNPNCANCPLHISCQGKTDPERYLLKKPKKQNPIRLYNILIWKKSNDALYLLRRQDRLLHGMYGFIQYDRANQPLPPKTIKLGSVIHHYSHFTIDADVYILTTDSLAVPKGGQWYNKEKIDTLPLSGVDKKVLSLLDRSMVNNPS